MDCEVWQRTRSPTGCDAHTQPLDPTPAAINTSTDEAAGATEDLESDDDPILHTVLLGQGLAASRWHDPTTDIIEHSAGTMDVESATTPEAAENQPTAVEVETSNEMTDHQAAERPMPAARRGTRPQGFTIGCFAGPVRGLAESRHNPRPPLRVMGTRPRGFGWM